MNLEGQNLESLRKMIRHLQEENQELKELLKKNNDLRQEIETKVREHYGIAKEKKKKEEAK